MRRRFGNVTRGTWVGWRSGVGGRVIWTRRPAVQLADSTAPDLTSALAAFERLGARPMAERAVRRLRALGVHGIPRGPRRATRAHPLLLTPRESEVLRMLGAGLTNVQIGERLVLSERTVAHHVSAILNKLSVKTRTEAAARAEELET
jgi:DNA-binding NarL/FixJ family response regulator